MKCVHNWDDHWHMGYVIGRICMECGRREFMPAEWCRKREEQLQSETPKPKPRYED
jgi:ribosomal protein L40E